MKKTTRRRTTAALTAGLALGAVLAMPGAAQAASCDRGEVCAYSARDRGGSIVMDESGDWSGSVKALSISNNGSVQAGFDHIRYQAYVDYHDGSVTPVTGCLHVPQPGQGGTWANLPYDTILYKATWGGECRSDEPSIKIGHRVWS
ncbi:peptidase inhibitor family I36 protein [Streptomyces diastatochromogenes]|nr:peptidase inhibitor family I36 protein [Streptomyces diastatochromogenes]